MVLLGPGLGCLAGEASTQGALGKMRPFLTSIGQRFQHGKCSTLLTEKPGSARQVMLVFNSPTQAGAQ